MFYALLKWLCVVGLLASGVVFLANGLGVTVPWVHYQAFAAQGVPVGLFLLVAGVALAVFWKITLKTTEEETRTESTDYQTDTVSTTVRKVKETVTTLSNPLD